ncbi:hypothetical protein [uncultured Cellulomonas sp.]|uniref:hypothetical protein n=1 Tax=uncultured Cellulomonas sp. TaxID=189682 RepID=UPI002628DC64|nr:hypothetical protein [uncultured Cellulomonas sp.]
MSAHDTGGTRHSGGRDTAGVPPEPDIPADAASEGLLPADPDNTDPTPGSDNDGIEPGYTPPPDLPPSRP